MMGLGGPSEGAELALLTVLSSGRGPEADGAGAGALKACQSLPEGPEACAAGCCGGPAEAAAGC